MPACEPGRLNPTAAPGANSYRFLIVAIVVSLAALAACSSRSSQSPYAEQGVRPRDTIRAQEFTRQAAAILHEEPGRAVRLLREALVADLWYGPAHNNLGVAHLSQCEYFEAAHEFEWARKLMPGHPDPRINLGLTLELAGRVDDAIASYQSALEVYPDHIAAIQGLVRLQLRHGRQDQRTKEYLSEVALRGENARWREWARERLISMN